MPPVRQAAAGCQHSIQMADLQELGVGAEAAGAAEAVRHRAPPAGRRPGVAPQPQPARPPVTAPTREALRPQRQQRRLELRLANHQDIGVSGLLVLPALLRGMVSGSVWYSLRDD